MKKTIVIYYSNKGNNKYLAQKIADNLNCDIEEIRPLINVQLLMMMGLSLGLRRLRYNIEDYDRVILMGPVWMGKFIRPLKDFVNKYKKRINELIFVSCCGSSFEKKDERFGHGLVFNVVKEMLGEKCVHCEALPITLVLAEDKQEDPETVMKTRLSDDNFEGEIVERYNLLLMGLSLGLRP
ncbi:MAG: hypothetical protein KAI81_01885 [Candidatus Marinimicrobia bacterium]|nr:hypothetical protein [Candidatus Neomarinimicrobiota bacterium]